jgi:hypothetical protein
MSFGFSVGDFIAAGKLIADILSALKDGSGSVSEYQHLMLELHGLQRVLEEVDKLEGPEELHATVNAVKATALTCKFPLTRFLEKIKKYDASLGCGNSAGRVRDTEKRIRWGLSKKEEIHRLRSEINSHVGSINLLLKLFQL